MADIPSGNRSSPNINHLSNDVLLEIFLRLPFKSAARCKCVSKRFLNLISAPSFQRQFISNYHALFKAFVIFLSPHELMLVFLPHQTPARKQYPPNSTQKRIFSSNSLLPDPKNQKPLLSPEFLIRGTVCGCSNAFLLCSSECNYRYGTGDGYYVLNPLTKQNIRIPSPPWNRNKCLFCVGFICDPFKQGEQAKTVTLNSHESDQPRFRVVLITSFISPHTDFKAEVFISETQQWEKPVVRCPNTGFAFAPHSFLGFAYEGRLYFMGGKSILVYDPFSNDEQGQGRTLAYPAGTDPMNIISFGCLGTCCGSLRIADIRLSDVRVWELFENQHWHLMHSTSLTGTSLPARFCADYYKKVGALHPHDGDIVYLYSYADGIFCCNLRTNKFEAIAGYERCDLSPFPLELPMSLQPSAFLWSTESNPWPYNQM